MKKVLSLILISFCGISMLSAQSTFLQKGQSGIGLSATIQESFQEDGFFCSLGYSFKGNFDIDITYGMFVYDNYKIGNTTFKDVKENVIGFELEYWILRTRTGTDRGIDVGVWGGYEKEEYKDDGTKIISTDGFSGGVEFAINFLINQKVTLQPYFILGYLYDTAKIESTGDTEDIKGGCSSFGTAIVYKVNDKSSLVFKFELDNDGLENRFDNVYEMCVGYYFGF